MLRPSGKLSRVGRPDNIFSQESVLVPEKKRVSANLQ